MTVTLEFFRAGQFSRQVLRVVDQEGEMLGANIIRLVLVLQGNQRGIIAVDAAVQAGGFLFRHGVDPFNGYSNGLNATIPRPALP
jgi:hypothetical protein